MDFTLCSLLATRKLLVRDRRIIMLAWKVTSLDQMSTAITNFWTRRHSYYQLLNQMGTAVTNFWTRWAQLLPSFGLDGHSYYQLFDQTDTAITNFWTTRHSYYQLLDHTARLLPTFGPDGHSCCHLLDQMGTAITNFWTRRTQLLPTSGPVPETWCVFSSEECTKTTWQW
jgi:hypothetical protein